MSRSFRYVPRRQLPAWVPMALVAGFSNACSDQPKVVCTSARIPYAARYSPVAGSSECAVPRAEELGVYTFNGSNGDGTPDWSLATLSIQPLWVYQEPSAGVGAGAFSMGRFDDKEPNARGLCTVSTLSATQVHVPEVPDGSIDANGEPMAPAPARDVRYEWSHVRILVTPETVGTAFSADLVYTSGDCTANYTVWAVAPAVSCWAASSEASQATIDPGICLPADPAQNRFTGSGIDPSFEVSCDPGAGLCVLTRDPAGGS